MADHGTPHFHNTPGVETIKIGARKFMCVGANPPFDHPHVFIDMGSSNDAICPYCSTRYVYSSDLSTYEASPAECAYKEPSAA